MMGALLVLLGFGDGFCTAEKKVVRAFACQFSDPARKSVEKFALIYGMVCGKESTAFFSRFNY